MNERLNSNRTVSLVIGIILISIGALALLGSVILPAAGWGLGLIVRMGWPLIIVGAGLAFVLPALLAPMGSGLGGLFIPGVPVLATGAVLFFTSTFNQWGAWQYLWPVEVLAVGLAFLLAAWKLRVIWLVIPALIVGLNGVLLQFCAITNWWSVWAAMWTVEPLALGLAFLWIGLVRKMSILTVLGLAFCGFAGAAFLGMSFILVGGWKLILVAWPALLILAGAGLLALGLVRRRPVAALR
jgi:hypothetical protein